MKLMCPAARLSLGFFATILIIFGLSTAGFTQKRSSQSKKPVAKKTVASTKDARKGKKADPRKEKATAKKDTRRDSKKDSRKDKQAARSNSRDRNAKDSKKPKNKAEARRIEAERRREEAARRAAALAEQRRREEIARQARERKLAFERGLRTETQANIAKDNTDGEDLRIRQAAVDALGSRAGTVVVMEAQTGKVVTIVNQDWAIHDGFKPCSTIKLVTGVAGLSENVIDSEGNLSDVRMKLDDAVAFSNNAYFQRVGSHLGNSKMISYAKTLGLGEPTGINADGEYAGKLAYGNNNPRIYSHGDDFEVTPLQLAVVASEISNGGKRVIPQISKGRYESTNFHPRFRQSIDLPQQDLQGMLPGMIGAAQYGTAHRGVDANLGIAGKTGSCIGKGSWVGLFTSVAPVENPKYSVVVITRGQGERGKYAAAVAGKIYAALSTQIRRDPNRYQAILNLRPQHIQIDSRTAAKMADEDEDDDDSGAADADSTDGRSTWVPAVKRNGDAVVVTKPLVKRTVESKPVYTAPKPVETKPAFPAPDNKPAVKQGKTPFPPVVITYKKDTDDVEQPAATQRPRIVKNN
ncbi:MAG: penicillin-binding transpeptidase domain-containing protein [Pyrinomonadaceae bacterium]